MDRSKVVAIIAVAALLAIVLGSLVSVDWDAGDVSEIGTEPVGRALFDEYGVTFLVVGLLMFAAMLGGVFLAREDEK